MVADRGMISAKTLAALEARGLEYVLGVRERSAKEVRTLVLGDDAPFVPLVIPRQGRPDTELEAKAVTLGARRYIVCRNLAEAKRDAEVREALHAIHRVNERLAEPVELAEQTVVPQFVRPEQQLEVQFDVRGSDFATVASTEEDRQAIRGAHGADIARAPPGHRICLQCRLRPAYYVDGHDVCTVYLAHEHDAWRQRLARRRARRRRGDNVVSGRPVGNDQRTH